jgi:hypothetical protein
MTEGIAGDLEAMRDILSSADWQGLYARLQEFVENYQQKIVHVTGGFQL